MLQRGAHCRSLQTLFSAQMARVFSTSASSQDAKSKHKEQHHDQALHAKFFENDFNSTSIKELEYVRSPFYDLSMLEHTKEGEEAAQFLTNIQLKIGMTQFISSKLQSQYPTKETVAFTRYADHVRDPEFRERLQHPMGEPLRRIDASKELFRVQKTSDHWQ